jgi:deoxyribodipyrimidine photo-lyase
MSGSLNRALVWFRRDLRASDNAALYHALKAARQVWCVFVYDSDILQPLPRRDRRVEFIHDSLTELDRQLRDVSACGGGARDAGLLVCHGRAQDCVVTLARSLGVQAVFANHDDEPLAQQRDTAVGYMLAKSGIAFHTSKDHVIFERSEILTQSGTPFSVFTPYKNAWLKKVEPFFVKSYPVQRYGVNLAPLPERADADLHCPDLPSLGAIGFERSNLRDLKILGGSRSAKDLFADFFSRIDAYGQTRDFPAIKGPSYLSVHLRFGTVSIRELAAAACARVHDNGSSGAAVWLSELIWRDFYHQILHHHPHVVQGSFKPEFDQIEWEQGEQADAAFDAWCQGRTGYPLVDAAMAQINQTGYMHNRLRMVVASFLTKDLGIDWRRGEAYFALQLNDFDLAANNGGWQWAASTGCDAQPYFRIFNPVSQSEKFDPQGKFIRRYLPQLAALQGRALHAPWTARPIDLQSAQLQLGRDYPLPIVNHDEARKRTLRRFSAAKLAP